MAISSFAQKQIRNLLIILLSSVLCGIVLSLFFIYRFGPLGDYIVQNTLLPSEMIETLSYNDKNYKTGGISRFVFDGIEFSYVDSEGMHQTIQIDTEQYKKIYDTMKSDKSIEKVSPQLSGLFDKKNSSLMIKVRTESQKEWQEEKKNFQEIDFAHEGFYRIELINDPSSRWVYFEHPGIDQKILQIVKP